MAVPPSSNEAVGRGEERAEGWHAAADQRMDLHARRLELGEQRGVEGGAEGGGGGVAAVAGEADVCDDVLVGGDLQPRGETSWATANRFSGSPRVRVFDRSIDFPAMLRTIFRELLQGEK